MNGDEHSDTLAALESQIALDDPHFIKRLAHIRRHAAVAQIGGFALLALGTLLFVSGLATQHIIVGVAGISLLLVAAAGIEGYNHHNRRAR